MKEMLVETSKGPSFSHLIPNTSFSHGSDWAGGCILVSTDEAIQNLIVVVVATCSVVVDA
jgi:hypothetical protein